MNREVVEIVLRFNKLNPGYEKGNSLEFALEVQNFIKSVLDILDKTSTITLMLDIFLVVIVPVLIVGAILFEDELVKYICIGLAILAALGLSYFQIAKFYYIDTKCRNLARSSTRPGMEISFHNEIICCNFIILIQK